MSENKKEKGNRQFFSYFKYMIFILIFVEILDTYTTNNLNVVVSDISSEFFPSLTENAAISFFQIFVAIATVGMYFVSGKEISLSFYSLWYGVGFLIN